MRSFATFATFASLAFATVSSALPTGPSAGGNVANVDHNIVGAGIQGIAADITTPILNNVNVLSPNQNTAGTTNFRRQLPPAPSAAKPVTDAVGGLGLGGGSKKEGRGDTAIGIPDVICDLNDKVIPLCHDLTAKITADPNIDPQFVLKLALDVLGQIKALLQGAVAQIALIIKGDINAVFLLKGQVIDISILAQLLAKLVTAVVFLLGLLVKILGSIDISALLALIAEIGALLAVIIGLVLKVAAGLLVHLCPLLACVAEIIISLKLTALIDILHLAA